MIQNSWRLRKMVCCARYCRFAYIRGMEFNNGLLWLCVCVCFFFRNKNG